MLSKIVCVNYLLATVKTLGTNEVDEFHESLLILSLLSLWQIGTEPSDNQYLVVDIGLGAVPIMMIGNCGPHHTLVKQTGPCVHAVGNQAATKMVARTLGDRGPRLSP